jgi:integrase
VTFKEAATQFFNKAEKEWRSARSRQQFQNTMRDFVFPIVGSSAVDAITKDLVLRVLEPYWLTKTVTMSRVRSRIEQVLSYAVARGLRSPKEENPAAWSHLKFMLPKPSKVTTVKHHPALPYSQMYEFMAALKAREGIAPKALQFAILTATRTGDIVGGGSEAKPPMLWTHVDLKARVWTVPSTKTETELRVPLSDRAVAILKALPRERGNEHVFVAPPGGGLASAAMAEVVRRINADRQRRGLPRFVDPKRNNSDVVPHGFRSSFRDWAGECTAFPNPIIELCLAHKVSSAVEASYLRSDLIDKRARLMQAWSDFCASPPVEAGQVVVPMRATT